MKKPMKAIATSRLPINVLFDKAEIKCVKCDAKMGCCNCWAECSCGWSYERGVDTKCNNPECNKPT